MRASGDFENGVPDSARSPSRTADEDTALSGPAECEIAIAVVDPDGSILAVHGDIFTAGEPDGNARSSELASWVSEADRSRLRRALLTATDGIAQSLEVTDLIGGRLLLRLAPAPSHTGAEIVAAIVRMTTPWDAGSEEVRARGTGGRAMERALADEHLFQQGFDNSPVGMLLAEPRTGACIRVNDALCSLLQRTRDQLMGSPITSFTPAEDHPALLRSREDVRAGRADVVQGEQRFVLPDGSIVWGLLHLTPIRRPDRELEAFHVQVIDITERKDREARLERDVEDAIWLGRIRAAIDDHRLLMCAQPIVDLTTGETVQHELLIRLVMEDGAIVPPRDFLPVAERYGLISEIDRWVIRQAVGFAEQGSTAEFNLSARSLTDETVLGELASAITSSDVDPSLLVVEVTETAVADHPEVGSQFVSRISALGCRLALDDFGTGYSSLAQLKHLPADYLKIDIEFVRDLVRSETDRRVVRGIVGLAREFEQATIAEGVEDEETLLLLKSMGVDHAQGYLFGRPAPCGEIPELRATRTSTPINESAAVRSVQQLFELFAKRDTEGMLLHYHADAVLRPFATAHFAKRPEPYVGREGLRTYMQDVERVWQELTLTPLTYRQAGCSVFAFGRAEGRSDETHVIAGILWIVRFDGDLIASVDVFQAVDGTPALSAPQLARLSAARSGA